MKIPKRVTLILLTFILSSTLISCTSKRPNMTPQISQMKAITELATLDVFYHNVAKHKVEDASGILLWKKDKHFWIEYSGIVKVGVDPSRLIIKINENTVTVQIPDAEVFSAEVEQKTFNKDSFIVAKDSAKPTAEDETLALKTAQDSMKSAASQDAALMASAKQRVQKLLEEYISNIGQVVGKEYSVVWVDVKGDEPQKAGEEPTSVTPENSTKSKDN